MRGWKKAIGCALLSMTLVCAGVPTYAFAEDEVAVAEATEATEATDEGQAPQQGDDQSDQLDQPEGTEASASDVASEPSDGEEPVEVEAGAQEDQVEVTDETGQAPAQEESDAAALSAQSDLTSAADATQAHVTYRTHVQKYGWQKYVSDGAMSGTSGKSKRLEGINIKLVNAPFSGGIEYRTHVQKIGWQGWRKDGKMSGTKGRALRLEAIQIRLYGQMAEHFDVYYRVHAQKAGWMGWACNGASSGTAGFAYRLEGIQILLMPKGAGYPQDDLGGMQMNTTLPFVQYKKWKFKSLKSLGIKYDSSTNKKVDNVLNEMRKFFLLHDWDYNASNSNYDKALGILWYVGANYRYGNGSYSAASMIDKGYGTCFAYSDLVYCMARKVGLKQTWLCVAGRPVSHNGMFYGSQHRTVVSYFDGKYWDLDGNAALYGMFYPQEISKSYADYLLGKSKTFTEF